MSELSEQNRKLLSAFGVDTPQTVSEFRLMRETMGALLDAARAEGPAPVSAIKADPASVLPVLAHLVETGQATPQQRQELSAALNLPSAPNLDLVERLREMVKTDHLRGCEGREYECTCGHIDRQDNMMLEAALALSQQDQVGLTTPAVLGEPSADALRSGKWRKRPVVIDAFRLGHDPMPDWFCDKRSANEITTHNVDDRWRGGPDVALIKTLEGTMRAEYGDWIIRGVQAEVYPCKPDIFAATYEPAGQDVTTPADGALGRQALSVQADPVSSPPPAGGVK